MSDTTEKEAAAYEGRAAVSQAHTHFDRVGDRLDELQREHDDEQVKEAFKQVEDLVMEFDEAMYEAKEAFDSVIEDE